MKEGTRIKEETRGEKEEEKKRRKRGRDFKRSSFEVQYPPREDAPRFLSSVFDSRCRARMRARTRLIAIYGVCGSVEERLARERERKRVREKEKERESRDESRGQEGRSIDC